MKIDKINKKFLDIMYKCALEENNTAKNIDNNGKNKYYEEIVKICQTNKRDKNGR